MNIAIDARWIFPEISGIGAYTRELIRQLALLDRANSYTLLFNNRPIMERTAAECALGTARNFTTRLVPFGVFSVRNQLQLPLLLAGNGFDIYHSTNYMIPLLAFPRSRRGRTRAVVTVHDVIPLLFPDAAPRSRKARLFPIYRRLMVEIGARATAIITDSEASRKDVIKHLHITDSAQHAVRSIHCGVSGQFSPRPGGHAALGPADATGDRTRTVLYVGRADPYKNVTTLVKAFATALKTCPFPLELVIAGSLDQRYPEARQLAAELGIGANIRWTGYITDSQLVDTYRNADLLVHPSRYEGFGLQVVEAMACGVPVVCSNAGSIPEVAGSAAILLDPDDVAGFAASIRKVLTEPAVARDLSRRGTEQAGRFTWARTAAETLAVYQEAIRG